MKRHPFVIAFLFLLALAAPARAWQWEESVPLTMADMDNPYRTLYITDVWKYHPGDSAAFADPDFDDSFWTTVSTELGAGDFPWIEWNGIGWFRITLNVDSSLVGVPFALDVVRQSGASEIFLNGELLYQFGHVSVDAETELPFQERRPRSIVFQHPGRHVLAVRYSNHNAEYFLDTGYNAGFRYLLVEMNHQVTNVVNMTRQATMNQFFFSGILLVFTLIHFLLFLFYAKQKENLYFALFTACFGILNYLNYETNFSTSGLDILGIIQVQYVFTALTITFFLRFSYSLFYNRLPRHFWLFVVGFAGLGAYLWQYPTTNLSAISLVVSAVTSVELVRILIMAVWRNKDGAYVFGVGMTIFLFTQIYQVLVRSDVISQIQTFTADISSVVGIVALLLTMSVSLSRSVAETNRRLESKLREVRELSEKTIEQELEKRLLEADNSRKTRELDEARDLQLSMLPQRVPAFPGLDVAVHMRTATEVGGDYYDFVSIDDRELIVAVGDATGHGLKAGMVVATAKSYFQTFAAGTDNLDLIRRMSKGIKNMNLRMLYMGLALARIEGRSIRYAGAGMPPILIYRLATDTVESFISKGMPLGSVSHFPYKEIAFEWQAGDVMLMLSDGLVEAMTSDRRELGMAPVLDTLRAAAPAGAQAVVDALLHRVDEWTDGTPLHDDLTMVVLRNTLSTDTDQPA